ncbi:MAG: hypothetical protein F4213_03230 [Boseongicola sp. SB0677_bin_26]|nr:hypothetical protein [Boseongicola sp. SB0665_bin_10]MYG25027.1 hypothetical protein [Boseongicola sp. SB0677_bin_26]
MNEDVTSMMPAVTRHLERLSESIGKLPCRVHAYVAGGAAVNHHVGGRISNDVDIKWSHRIAIPPDLQVFTIEGESPETRNLIAMDGGFTDVLGSFPPGWEDRAEHVATAGDIVIHVIDPVDLAASKVARFQDRDRDDIRRLAQAGLVDPDLFEARVREALDFYVGDTTFVQWNARDAEEIVRDAAPGLSNREDTLDDPSP